MNILIIEDESVAADRLESRLKEIDPGHVILAKLSSVKASVRWLKSHTADLIFLDIQLSDGLSFAIFDEVEVTTPVIFTTAYDQYAMHAFNLNSVAYLLKPVTREDLLQSFKKLESMKSAFQIDFEHLMAAYKGEKLSYRNRFLIRLGEKFRKLEARDIAYCYALEKDVFAKSFENQIFPMDYSLDHLEEDLDPKQFFRINRKYLVNMDAIRNMVILSRSRIQLELHPPAPHEMETVVSVSRSADFRKWMDS